MNSYTKLAVLILVLLSGIVLAETKIPELPFSSIRWKPISKNKPATILKMGSLEVTLERTPLSTILNTANRGEILHRGDAGESIYWLCYTVQGSVQHERIWILSHGEMGGSNHSVTGVTAQALKTNEVTKDCPSLPNDLQPISFEKNFWLGMSQEEAQKILGTPSHDAGSWKSFNYQGKAPGNCSPDGFDELNWLVFRTEQGKLTTIHAGQVTSC